MQTHICASAPTRAHTRPNTFIHTWRPNNTWRPNTFIHTWQSVGSGSIHSLALGWAVLAYSLGMVVIGAGLAAGHVSLDRGALLAQSSPGLWSLGSPVLGFSGAWGLSLVLGFSGAWGLALSPRLWPLGLEGLASCDTAPCPLRPLRLCFSPRGCRLASPSPFCSIFVSPSTFCSFFASLCLSAPISVRAIGTIVPKHPPPL